MGKSITGSVYVGLDLHKDGIDAKLQTLLVALQRLEVTLGGRAKRSGKNAPSFDLRTALALARRAGPGRLGPHAHQWIGDHLGVDGAVGDRHRLEPVASVKHFCSWLALRPGTTISGGKVLSARTRCSCNRVRQAFKLAAMSLSRNGPALGAFYRCTCSRMDKPRANSAVANKLARMVYSMLTRGEGYVDQGQQHYEGEAARALHRRARAPRRRSGLLGLAAGRDNVSAWITLLVCQEVAAWSPP